MVGSVTSWLMAYPDLGDRKKIICRSCYLFYRGTTHSQTEDADRTVLLLHLPLDLYHHRHLKPLVQLLQFQSEMHVLRVL